MPKTTNKKKPQGSKATAQKRPSYKKQTAISIRLPEQDLSNQSKPKFFINYVLNSGEQVKRPCTHKVWKDINAEKLFQKFRYNFEVLYDDATGIVQHLTSSMKREHLPAGFSEEDVVDADSNVSNPTYLEVVVDPENTVKVARAPSDCGKGTEDEVLDSLASDTDVKSGDYLSGKYRVEEIREREGFKTIFVDVNFTQ